MGFFLRLWGIGYGLPDLSHPDELRVILDTLSMGHRLSLLPERPDYSLLYRYFLLISYASYFIIGKLIGVFKDVNDFASQFIINPSAIYIITRGVSVVFSVFTGIFAYFLVRRFFDRITAFVAFVFVLFEFQSFQHSQWGIYPAAFTSTTLPVFYFMFTVIKKPSLKNFMMAGVFTGISISTQNHGIFLLPSLGVTVSIHFLDNKNRIASKIFFKYWTVLILSLFIFSLLGNFYWLFIFEKVALKYTELLGVTKVGFASCVPYANNILSMSLWFFNELIRQDLILGIILVAGIIYSIFRHTKLDIIFLTYVLMNLFIFSDWGFRLLHDMLGVMPITCIFGARFLIDMLKKIKLKEISIGIISCLVILPLAYDAIVIDIKKNKSDTRQLARTWIEENIPISSKIAIDWHVFSVPLYSNTPLYFRNPVAKKYYEGKIPQEIKKEYQEYLKDKKVYEIVELMKPLDKPFWPEDMPEEVKEEAAKHEVYRDIYSNFHFAPLDSLKDYGVGYIVISSYTYGFFLLNPDPNKKGLFNPFIKDRPWLNFSHADHYIDDNRYGLLYFIAKEGRDFYEPLLDNKLSNIKLIQEFSPTDNLGPTIKIFKISKDGN